MSVIVTFFAFAAFRAAFRTSRGIQKSIET